MAAIVPLYHLMKVDTSELIKEEKKLLEAKLFVRICEELKAHFRQQFKAYFRLIKLTEQQEDTMIEIELLPLIIKDIISTNEYTLQGIAYYSNTHEDVIYDILTGRNTDPSSTVLRKVIGLHLVTRRELYRIIMNKIRFF